MPRHDDEIKARLLETFRIEAAEHLATLDAGFLALEQGPPAEQARALTEEVFRAMHTLKGAARSVGLLQVESVCQACELLLGKIRRGRLPVTPSTIAGLEAAVRGIRALLSGEAEPAAARELVRQLTDDAGEDGGEPAEAAAAPAELQLRQPPSLETIRVDAGKLDALLVQGEELLAVKLASAERAHEARALADAATQAATAVRHVLAAEGIGIERASPALAALRSSEAQTRMLLQRLSRDRHTVDAAVDRLVEETRLVRMMPAATILDALPVMVRDLARAQEKQIEWSARGAELELDRRVLQMLKDPLIHLVRNSVDHGIELPTERRTAGKDPHGRISLELSSREDGRVELLLEDDGRGIDPDRVRDAAVRGRIATAEAAQQLSDADALEFVFRSGLSTSPVITNISGHGLGLAIVREQVERLEGELTLESRPGATRVRVVVPAAIATFRGLLVRAGGQLFLLPVRAVEQIVALAPEAVALVEGREAIRWREQPLPLASLAALLELAPFSVDGEIGPCVVLAAGGEQLGLLVDEVLGEQEVLVKELSPPLIRVRYIGGAGLLGSGELVLILRAADLVRGGRHRLPIAPRRRPEVEARAPRVLVVDDAVTTRTMERNLLEAAGYRVQVAVDGAEAYSLLKTEAFDLVVSDVDMPRMNGFELTARIRADEQFADLPVVLVTALESREDKERGVEVGANAYVVKSSFEQSNLLEIIRRLGVVAAPGVAR